MTTPGKKGQLIPLLRNRFVPSLLQNTRGHVCRGLPDHPGRLETFFPMPPYVSGFSPVCRILEFGFVYKGSCILNIGSHFFRLNAGDTGIILRNRFHYESYVTPGAPYGIIWLTWASVRRIIIRLCHYQKNSYELQRETLMVPVEAAETAALEKELEKSTLRRGLPAPCRRIFLDISRRLANPGTNGIVHTVRDRSVGLRQKKIVHDAVAFIRAHCCDGIYLKDAADHAGLHPNYLDNLLKDVTCSSFKKHVIYHRLREAQRLLNRRDLSISEVAYRCGFSDPYNFSSFFKKHNGLSPRLFRDRYFNLDKS